MDEYFCPNCGVTLNDQFGFDPSCGTWACTSCGCLLMDEDMYDGDSYEGVAWFCDDCGALLNRQSGFTDSCGSWTCTECGHLNGTAEDDIVNNYLCPQCGARLNEQWEFDEYEDNHECSSCGARLHHDYRSDPYELVDEEDDVDDEDDEDDEYDEYDEDDLGEDDDKNIGEEDAHSSEEAIQASPNSVVHMGRLSERYLHKQRIKAFLFSRKKIQLNHSYTELLGKSIDDVELSLHNLAFININKVPIKDVYEDSPYSLGQVERVVIHGDPFFNKGDAFPYDAEIVLTYHAKREITIPFNERSLWKMDYIDVENTLQDLGFTEIYECPIRDLVTGWITKNGSVEKVTIGDVCQFKKESVFAYDTEITIEYHTFK